MRMPKLRKSEPSSALSDGPDYKKRLLDPSKVVANAVVRKYRRGQDGSWHHEDITILQSKPFERHGLPGLWTIGRVGTGRQEYFSLPDMGIVAYRNGTFNPSNYTVLLKAGRK